MEANAEVTRINGPVSCNILKSPNKRVTFYLFGDAHFSQEDGCGDPRTIKLQPSGANLTRESILSSDMRTVDITAALYTMLKYNNMTRKPTDLFIESPHGEVTTKDAVDEDMVKKGGWLDDCERLFKVHEQFLPHSKIHRADIRHGANVHDNDILSVMHSLMEQQTTLQTSLDILSVVKVLFASASTFFDAYTQIGGLDKLNIIKAQLSTLGDSRVKTHSIRMLSLIHI